MPRLPLANARKSRTIEWSMTNTLRSVSTFGSKRAAKKTTNGTTPNPSSELPSITSKRGIGWFTPTLMVVCYVLALILAITHLLLFRFIDGREADGPNKVASQSFVTTTSNGIAICFGIALRTSLGIAFCQHLWRLLRLSAMKVSLIDNLFSMRTNPFLILRATVLKATPSLCVCVVIMLASQIVTAFPPGAINVITSTKSSTATVQVPSFNASFMGNGSGVDANANSFTTLMPAFPDSYIPGFPSLQATSNNLINRIARQILTTNVPLPTQSPCGQNCTYTTTFDGPWFQCSTTTYNYTYSQYSNDNLKIFAAYTGRWDSGIEIVDGNPLHQKLYNGTFTRATFNTTTDEPIAVTITDDTDYNATAIIQRSNTTCIPGRAKFTVNNTFTNSILKTSYIAEPISQLVNLAVPTHDHVVMVPGILAPVPVYATLGTTPANWTDGTRAIYRDTNLMALCGALLSWLNGNYTGTLPSPIPQNSILWNITRTPGHPLSWFEAPGRQSGGVTFDVGESTAGIIISTTEFNLNLPDLTDRNSTGPLFSITAEVLNDYLFKLTSSTMGAYARWPTTANATTTTNIAIYTFSQPLNLLLPYFVTLILSIPLLVLGLTSLIKNSVSATDGGFIQLITTTTGSAALDRAAAGGCLGGSENVPRELKDLEIRFGELKSREPGGVKLAGFGTEEEVVGLMKGEKYGVARWI